MTLTRVIVCPARRTHISVASFVPLPACSPPADSPPGRLLGNPAYHALPFGWLMSGLAGSVTGKGMRALIREELAEPLGTDGLHLGRPPAAAPTRVAEIIMPQDIAPNPVFSYVACKVANELSGG